MTIDDLLTSATQCLAFDTKAKLTFNETTKIGYLTQRNLIKSRMIWQHGLVTTRQAFEVIGAARLIDEAPKSDLRASAICCMDYEETAIAAAEIGNEDAVKENIDARDFLISKIVWQHGAFRVCNVFQEIGFDPIERKELIQILFNAQKLLKSSNSAVEKSSRSIGTVPINNDYFGALEVDTEDVWADQKSSLTKEQDKLQELLDRLTNM
jgi:hypothetical protein